MMPNGEASAAVPVPRFDHHACRRSGMAMLPKLARRRISISVVALAAALFASMPGVKAASGPSPHCGSTWAVVLGGKGGIDPLHDVDAVSAREVWAGGELQGSGGPYVLHRDEAWSQVPIPVGPGGVATIEAVDARNADDVWAVGEQGTKGTPGRYPYAIHWN